MIKVFVCGSLVAQAEDEETADDLADVHELIEVKRRALAKAGACPKRSDFASNQEWREAWRGWNVVYNHYANRIYWNGEVDVQIIQGD